MYIYANPELILPLRAAITPHEKYGYSFLSCILVGSLSTSIINYGFDIITTPIILTSIPIMSNMLSFSLRKIKLKILAKIGFVK